MKDTVKFRRYDEDIDLNKLWAVYSNYATQIHLTATKPYNSKHQFAEEIKRNISYVYRELFIVYDEQNEYIGFVIAYDYNANDATVKLVVYIADEFRGTAYAGIVAMRFINLLFKYYSIRKVYSEVYGFNDESIRCHKSLGFEQEGCYKEDHYYDGKYWDTYIFSYKRERFFDKFSRLIKDA